MTFICILFNEVFFEQFYGFSTLVGTAEDTKEE